MSEPWEQLKHDYSSPRWSAELLDCSMPLTFDTYSVCAYNCLYCFSWYQKAACLYGYSEKVPRTVNVEKVKELFTNALAWKVTSNNANSPSNQFAHYIRQKRVMQWGGLADQFDEYERRFGATLHLLRFFDSIDYPISFSTKAAWWTADERYMSLFRKHTHNWHVKVSIITADPLKAKAIERGAPPPQARLGAIRNLTKAGIHVTLRLRPYIFGVSNDYRELMTKAREAGADSVTTEFFCLEARANDSLKARYKEISRFVGYDVWEFYREHTPHASGYRRLNRDLKAPIVKDMRNTAHRLGMRFYVSDAHCKEQSDYTCCCGVPDEWPICRGHWAEALQIAKRREDGRVYFSDIKPELDRVIPEFQWYRAEGFNTASNEEMARRHKQTMKQWVAECWNDTNNSKSPAKYFGGVMVPIGIDDQGNVVYQLDKKKANL